MGKILSSIADTYGLHNLHKIHSKTDQFNYNKQEVSQFNSDFSQFYIKPSLPQINFKKNKTINNYENGKLTFLSQVENENSNKNAIFYYNLCSNQDENINVILIHGWRADNLGRLENVFLSSYINNKYNVYSYILPFHMERNESTSLYSGEYFLSADVARTLKSVQQAVSDVRALISYIKTIKKGKVIIIGLSIGGIITNLLGEVEENMDALISLFYGNDLSFTVFETEAGKYIKKDFTNNNFSRELLENNWRFINPSLQKPILSIDKILLVSGKYDKYVLNEDTDKLWERWGRPERISYSCGHSGIVLCKNKIRNDVLKFIERQV